MSIIYEALKKVEKSTPPQKIDSQNINRSKPKVYFLYILLVCTGIFIANIFFGFLTQKSKAKVNSPIVKTQQVSINKTQALALPQGLPNTESTSKEISPPEIKEPSLSITAGAQRQSPPALTLNGVFFSQDEGYALVNNRIVMEGDLVEGAQVKQITLDTVELDFRGSVIKLTTNK